MTSEVNSTFFSQELQLLYSMEGYLLKLIYLCHLKWLITTATAKTIAVFLSREPLDMSVNIEEPFL
jgi:hypothetical protein